jgi:peroxiredoxin
MGIAAEAYIHRTRSEHIKPGDGREDRMQNKANVIVVVLMMFMAVGVVAFLANQKPKEHNEEIQQEQVQEPAATPSAQTPEQSSAQEIVSPDITRMNPFDYLDLIPAGRPAPNFTHTAADGKRISLADFKGKKNVVLIFYQGSFCPVCGHQLESFQTRLDELNKLDTEIIAISADDAAHARQSVGEHGLSFAVIPDAEKDIIKKYGVENIVRDGIAYPSLYIVDKQGNIRFSFANQEGKRLQSGEVIPELKKINS